MKRSLIIGGAGFVGHHLARHLHPDLNWQVAVTKLPNEQPNLPFADVYDLDILDAQETKKILFEFKPDYIFHLAAQSSAALSWEKPAMTVDINIKGTINVLEAVRSIDSFKTRILLIGSSEEYGRVTEAECPINEKQETRPCNIYAATKVCQETIGILYNKAYGIDMVATRSFNHIGPGQLDTFVVSDFCKQVAQIEAGKQDPIIKVGNLMARRDFSDVCDIVRAYSLIAEKGNSGEIYNVGSGKAVAIQEILEMILKQSAAEIKVVIDPVKFRPLDAPLNIADISKLHRATGWVPEITLATTITKTLNYWRKLVNGDTNLC